MKNLWTTIMVKDMSQSLEFYTKVLDLKVDRQFETPDMKLAFLGEGQTKLELIERKGMTDIQYSPFVSTGFQVENAQDFQKNLQAKGFEIDGPYKPNPNVSYFFIKDPNGYRIQLVEQN